MSKELETLEKLKEHLKYERIDNLSNTEYYDILNQALHRLESIDNAEPSEALECLEEIGFAPLNECCGSPYTRISNEYEEDYNTIKQALLKAQEQELHNGGRLPNKEILSLKQCIEQCKDKPILYISETYGNKYIVPQKELDDLTKEKELSKGQMKYLTEVVSEFQKIVRIIKPSLRLVGNCLQAKAPFVDDDHPWVFIKEITDEEELKLIKRMLE
jgi:hypothetical protein